MAKKAAYESRFANSVQNDKMSGTKKKEVDRGYQSDSEVLVDGHTTFKI